MINYDFKILQPIEFECLSRDLIQARDEVFIESFTEGNYVTDENRETITDDWLLITDDWLMIGD